MVRPNTMSGDTFADGVETNYVAEYPVGRSVASPAYGGLTATNLTIKNVSNDGVAVLTQGTGNQIVDNMISNAGGYGVHIHAEAAPSSAIHSPTPPTRWVSMRSTTSTAALMRLC
jgi:hypothetical protein